MDSEIIPRYHHYLFAHRVLPHYACMPGVDIFQVLEEQRENILKQLWAITAEYVELDQCLPFSGFKIYFVKSPPFMGMVIVLPAPRIITEARERILEELSRIENETVPVGSIAGEISIQQHW